MPAFHMKPMTTTTRRLPQSTMSTAGSMYMANRHHVEIGTPTPVPCNLPRPQNMNGRAVSSSSIYMSKIPPQPQSRIPSAPVGSHAMLGKDATRRPPKRESFKPRSSIIPMMCSSPLCSDWEHLFSSGNSLGTRIRDCRGFEVLYLACMSSVYLRIGVVLIPQCIYIIIIPLLCLHVPNSSRLIISHC
jgi:hypothetical protein